MIQKNRSYANRGAFLERIIDMANNKYRNAGVADIRKVPTPVKITSTKGQMVTGRKEKATWVDYSGVYNGRAIIFDAKQTNETSFPLKNISLHQYELLKSWHEKGAGAFLLVYFSKEDKYFVFQFEDLQLAWERAKIGGRKSISYKEFLAWGYEVKSNDGYTLHYLEAV